jgi:hypothetical protein
LKKEKRYWRNQNNLVACCRLLVTGSKSISN